MCVCRSSCLGRLCLNSRAAPPGSKESLVESRVPGYTGFQAGSQHIFGDTYGRMTGSLRKEHQSSPGDKNTFLTYEENRGGHKNDITLLSSTRDKVTDKSSRSHVPGYAGHCPAQREAIGKRFGVSTADPLYSKSRDAVWYGGDNSPSVPKSMLPTQMGPPRETGLGVADADLSTNRLPGYTGFIKHSKDTFAKTYGETTRRLAAAPAKMDFTTDIGRPFGDWVLAGNNKGTNHLPGYAGHVPGYRDRPVGDTFGDSTRAGIFNDSDKTYKLKSQHIPASMYHSGLRMSEAKKKVVKSAVQLGTDQWCVRVSALPSSDRQAGASLGRAGRRAGGPGGPAGWQGTWAVGSWVGPTHADSARACLPI
eukprot:SAG22_NODE_105_length_20045_cov_23.373308_3_plen_365_part_00